MSYWEIFLRQNSNFTGLFVRINSQKCLLLSCTVQLLQDNSGQSLSQREGSQRKAVLLPDGCHVAS